MRVGRAVADTGWTGVFGMATLPDARRHGVAAVRLYRRAGFGEACAYHYRIEHKFDQCAKNGADPSPV